MRFLIAAAFLSFLALAFATVALGVVTTLKLARPDQEET